jgi:hypothetical protein
MTNVFLILLFIFFFTLPLFAQSVDTAWVRRYNGPGNYDDKAYTIAVDGSGNVYVTGYSWGSGTLSDYATIKYDPAGNQLWVQRYNGPGNSTDAANAIAVDGSGNVYVTGHSIGSGTSYDYATIKYSPDGDTVWVRRFDGQGSGWGARDIAVDSSGNVYVTGASGGKFTTIKYAPDGDTAWIRQYNGPLNFDDVANAITVDNSGNVYVTGESWDTTAKNDYTTIRYYPNGDTAWVRRFSGPGSSWDVPYKIASDESGNTFVTGTMGTIKYDINGNQLWNKWWGMGAGNDMIVAHSGNVYVGGWSLVGGPMTKYATIKYYPDGDTAWIRVNTGSASPLEHANSIAVDDSGNAYVTGNNGTIKYSNEGDSLWSVTGIGLAIALDGSENIYVTGWSLGSGEGNYYDYATIKYVQFLRGDVNNDKSVSMVDIVYLVSYLFKKGPQPSPILQVGDANCDGKVNIVDVVYLVAFLFKGGKQPCR